MIQPHGLLFRFILLHISDSLVSTSLVGHVLYSADLMSVICSPYLFLIVHRYIYSRYSSVFPILYQLYHSLPSSTLISFSSLYLKLQPELLLKIITKPRLFSKVVLCSNIFSVYWSLLFGFSIITKYYLQGFHSDLQPGL